MRNHHALNILIRGGGFINKGAEAMTRVAQRELAKRLGRCRFFIQCQPGFAGVAISNGIEPVSPFEGTPASKLRASLLRFGKHLFSPRARYAPSSGGALTIRDLQSVLDVLVDISGFAFGDQWGPQKGYLSALQRFGRLWKTMVFLPQAWGPFRRHEVATCTAAILRHADFAYARDKESYGWLKGLKGAPPDNIGLAPDIAFLFQGGPQEEAIAVLRAADVEVGGKPLVGIAPNMRVYERTEGEGTANEYVRLLISVAKHFAENEGCSVVVIPHEIRPLGGHRPDDPFLCDLIARGCGENGEVRALLGEYSAETLKAVIGQLDFLVGSRFHSLVAAFSQFIPATAIGWSHKYLYLFDDVGLKDFALGHGSLDDNGSFTAILEAWKKRDWIKEQLVARVPAQRESAAAALDHAAEIIRHKCQ